MPKLNSLSILLQTASDHLLDALRFTRGILQPRAPLAAESLSLHKRLGWKRLQHERRANLTQKTLLAQHSRRIPFPTAGPVRNGNEGPPEAVVGQMWGTAHPTTKTGLGTKNALPHSNQFRRPHRSWRHSPYGSGVWEYVRPVEIGTIVSGAGHHRMRRRVYCL